MADIRRTDRSAIGQHASVTGVVTYFDRGWERQAYGRTSVKRDSRRAELQFGLLLTQSHAVGALRRDLLQR